MRVAGFLLAATAVCGAVAKIDDVVIRGDDRASFSIESFGFLPGGKASLSVKNFELHPGQSSDGEQPPRMAFILRKYDTAEQAEATVQVSREEGVCLLDLADVEEMPPIQVDNGGNVDRQFTFDAKSEGLYNLAFVRCAPATGTVSFDLEVDFHNPGPTYLGAGDSPLPTLFLLCSLAFSVLLAGWVFLMCRNRDEIHLVHHLMSLLLVFKVLSLVFQSVMMHFIKARGHTVGWNVLYYVFAFLRGMLLFVVILLIGAGWSLVKPFLSAREKSVLVFVLALQVLDNVALVAVEEAVPGSQAFVRWISNLMHIVDIVCCCAILFPIVWSIRTLSASAASDGRLSLALLKLRQFRQFYVLVVIYVYFTRIVVFLIESNLNYRLTWMGRLCAEGAAFLFYAFAGWKFRPMADNPYLRIAGDEDSAVEEEEGAEQERRELEMEVRREAGDSGDERAYDVDDGPGDEEDEEAGEAYADVAARAADRVGSSGETAHLTSLPTVDSDSEGSEEQ